MENPVDWHSPYSVMVFIIPWIVSGLGVWMTHLTGHKNPRGWVVGVVLQVVWFVFVVLTHAWGFLFLNFVRIYQYYKNYRRWKKDSGVLESPDDPQGHAPSKFF